MSPQKVLAASTCGTYGMGDVSGVCQINDCDQLFQWAASPDAASMARSYKITQNLTCPGDQTTTPIGSDTLQFTGTFDGGGNTMQYINIDASGGWNAGLFSNASGATFKDLTIFFANITPHGYSGALVGIAADGTSIKNVHGDYIHIDSSGGVGGLVGQLNDSTISYSSVIDSQLDGSGQEHGGLVGAVVGTGGLAVSKSYVGSTTIAGGNLVGGLIGSLDGAQISDVYAQASLTVPNGVTSGGLVGYIADGTISNAYAAGSITGANYNSTGGLVGDIASGVTIQNSFAAVTGYSVYAFYGTSDADPPLLLNNFYQPYIANNQVCYSGTDGSEPNCGYDDNGTPVGNWLDRNRQPVKSWDTFETWSLFPSSGGYPVLLAEGQITPAPFDSGDGGLNTPYVISNCRQLQHMQDNLAATYTVSGNVDCTETKNWHGGKGFDPVGTVGAEFTGNLIGSGVINNLYIDRVNDTTGQQDGDEEYVGLFGAASQGLFANFKVQHSRIRGYRYVGGIIGYADFVTISGVEFNTTSVPNDCNSSTGECVWARYGEFGGGIVGHANNSILENVRSGGSVKGSGITIGGIAGRLETYGQLNTSSSSANIDGGSDVGGLVGLLNASSITGSTATGDILVQTDASKAGDRGGGAVGSATNSVITDVHASGDVSGQNQLGGLIGSADTTTITESDSNGELVNGSTDIGGLIGYSVSTDISNSDSFLVNVTGQDNTGGFVGSALCSTTIEESNSYTDVSGTQYTGGFVGVSGCQGAGVALYHVTATGNVVGYSTTGGLIGSAFLSTINESYATGNVTGTFDSGGLAGELLGFDRDEEELPSLITKSFATGDVTSTGSYSGGLVGHLVGAVVSNSYARGDVHDDISSGGLVGYANETSAIQYSYSTGEITSGEIYPGGVVGSSNDGLLADHNYWDATINPDLINDGGGVGLSTADLQTQSILEADSFDFTQIWGFSPDINDGYACLQWSDEGCSGASVQHISPLCEETQMTATTARTACELQHDNTLTDSDITATTWSARYKKSADSDWTYVTITDPSKGVMTFTGLEPNTEYDLGLRAVNNLFDQWFFAQGTTLGANSDKDGDNILDVVENSGPNHGDANNDGILDSMQASVATFSNPVSGDYSVLVSTCESNFNIQLGAESDSNKDVGYSYPAGLMGFVLRNCGANGVTATVTQYHYGNFTAGTLTARKWDTDTHTYSTIPGAALTNVTIGGQHALKVVYQIQDGGSLDQDHTADGNIKDPSGPGQSIGLPNTGFSRI